MRALNIVKLAFTRLIIPIKRFVHVVKLNKQRKIIISQLRGKNTIKVAFFAVFDSTWKCDSLYRKMLANERFEPIIVICPVVNFGYDNMINRIDECGAFFTKKGYSFVRAYDVEDNKYMDVINKLHPDLIVFTSPYKGLVHDDYYLDNYENILSCYVPYFYESGNDDMFFNLDFHNYVWKYYVEDESIKREQEKKIHRNRKNVVPVGFCAFDEFKEIGTKSKKNNNFVTIIWAPHHMIDKNFTYVRDGFFKYYDLFFELADKYRGSVRFIYRPHPLLKNKLEKTEYWGELKTKEYYTKWSKHPYCSIEENSNYIDLFKRSDAIIHDCGSFITEYLYEDKPALFTGTEEFTNKLYWQSAIDAINCYYRTDSADGIVHFIDDVVKGNNDPKKIIREKYIANHLHPEYDVAQNIIDDILHSIDN